MENIIIACVFVMIACAVGVLITKLIYGEYNQIFKTFSMTPIELERDEHIFYHVLQCFLKRPGYAENK